MRSKGDRSAGRKAGRWMVATVALGAVLLSALAIWLGQRQAIAPPPAAAAGIGQSVGPGAAPVIVEEFADFQCPFCRVAAQTTGRRLVADAQAPGSNFRFVFRSLTFIGPESQLMAEAAACAGAQGRFFPYMEQLYAEQRPENSGYFTRERLLGYAAGVGLDPQPFTACLDQAQMRQQVAADKARADVLKINSTPTFVVNGRPLASGLQSYEQVRQAIAAAAGR